MSILSPITTFGTGTYTVTRQIASTYINGYVVPGSTSTFTAVMSVQPPSTGGNEIGRVLQALPEAQHGKEIRVAYTATELKTRAPGNEPDEVTIASETWEVLRAELWQFRGIDHWRVYLARKDLP